ncbi:MAG: SHOCT domain-containing protein [Alphaproteobacteria bacterium]|nr:SHOCT domain-containing protein [Alphaproteobacteria bacterium]
MKNLLVGTATAVVTFTLSLPALADGAYWDPMHHGGGAVHGIFSFLVVALVGVGLFVLLRRRGVCGHGGRHSARAILDERFAKGEIDQGEYEGRRDVLS